MTEVEGAIGVIGGADGPTVIFISGNVTALIVTAAVILCAAMAAIVLGVKWRRRKKQQASTED